MNTIVIVTSDNADFGASVADLRGRKGDTFEGGMRAPSPSPAWIYGTQFGQ